MAFGFIKKALGAAGMGNFGSKKKKNETPGNSAFGRTTAAANSAKSSAMSDVKQRMFNPSSENRIPKTTRIKPMRTSSSGSRFDPDMDMKKKKGTVGRMLASGRY